jgi:hypothetical protein
MPLSVEEGSGASSRSQWIRMAQTGSPVGTEALELFLSGRTETVRGNAPRLPRWWKRKCRRIRRLIHVYADSSH